MKWLLVAPEFPYPLHHGTYLRIYHLARALTGLGDSVAVLAPAGDYDGAAAYAAAGITVLGGGDGQTTGPYRGAHRPNAALDDAVAHHAGEFDAVVLTHARALQHAAAGAAAGCVIADLVDDLVLEERRKLWRDLNLLGWVRRLRFLAAQRRYERRHLPGVGLATFVSEADRSSFAGRHRSIPAAVAPNGVDVDALAPPTEMQGDNERPPTVLFLGRFSHPPNADAARYLLGQIAPLIRREEPRARCVILGADPPADLHRLASGQDRITGWVDDIRPELWAADVVLLPMRLGTGIKNKLLEAWAAERAVVATSLACQGVPARPGENLLCADTPRQMAAATVRLLRDPAERAKLGRHGRQVVTETLTWSVAARRLRDLARQVS